MLKRIGVENKAQLVVFIALSMLVLVTPLGNEASHPIVLGIYRSLLFIVTIAAIKVSTNEPTSAVCPYFLAAVGGAFVMMSASVLFETGSRFEGIYVFYETALFIVAFIALAHFQRARSLEWKRTVFMVVVAANLMFMAVALIMERRPIVGTFVNPNYFASFLLPGIAVCLAYAVFGSTLAYRLGAFGVALILYFGIIQASSRGATLAAMAMAGLGIFRLVRQRGIRTAHIFLLGAAIAAVTAAAGPALIQKFLDRGGRDPYNYQRPQIWLGTLRMIGDNPIFGVGPGRYYYVSKLYTPAVEGTIARYRKWPNIAHSEYLHHLAENGIPASLLLFAIGGFLFRSLWKRAEGLTGEPKVFQEAAVLAAVGLGSHALVDNNWSVPVLAAGLAVISQADILPYRAWPRVPQWTPTRRTLLAAACAAIFVQSTLIPTLGLYLNESGHQAYVADNFDRAELMHRMAIGILPDHPVLLDNLGMVYLDEFTKTRRLDYLDQAKSAFQSSMAANPHFDVPAGHLENALIQSLTGDLASDRPIHEKIVAADRHVLAANPFNPFIRRNLAEALYNIGAKDEAAAELQKAIAIEPNYVPGYLRLAEWYGEGGRSSEEDEYRRRAIDLVTRYQNAHLADPFEALLLGRPDSAEQRQ